MAQCSSQGCGGCSQNCPSAGKPDFRAVGNPLSSVKKVIGIVSGKGGVGKSLVTAPLASSISQIRPSSRICFILAPVA